MKKNATKHGSKKSTDKNNASAHMYNSSIVSLHPSFLSDDANYSIFE
jgi:hypothetical protein